MRWPCRFDVSDDGGGIVTSHVDIGFVSIGTGGIHSSAYFMQLPFNHQVGYHHALRTTFFAKKRAEVSPGVGVQTDMFLITGNGVSAIQAADLSLMEQGYLQHRKQSDRWLDRLTRKLATRGQEADAVKENVETPLTNSNAPE
ncbi:hypothetical protein Q4F19_12550 [Sphingomonas sp. BIUV-7]|uniref:Uncharacterized protein n=1 Tax=Sphingomonas natans TaxID=3063330 RepID=A0ABT8YBX4_9SPHN|nr:hypothetical protein [Sphingomonas sp. BIUV-7]MDO6415214.1 hypothetical protein [Sphingomonas sp. BIUV-7]